MSTNYVLFIARPSNIKNLSVIKTCCDCHQ